MGDNDNISQHSKNFGALRDAFLSTAPVATKVFAEFIIAATKLGSHEHSRAFNKTSAAATQDTSAHLVHLRSPDHMAALRVFALAKENLLEVSPDIGQQIATHVEKDIHQRPLKK